MSSFCVPKTCIIPIQLTSLGMQGQKFMINCENPFWFNDRRIVFKNPWILATYSLVWKTWKNPFRFLQFCSQSWNFAKNGFLHSCQISDPAMHQCAHAAPLSFKGYCSVLKDFDMLHYTLQIPFHYIHVDIEGHFGVI